ncbi:MAG: hypothetical protein H7Z20_07830 [Bdellovibrio sp.]|nr:hypothetical protein [Methylotenera sp.]
MRKITLLNSLILLTSLLLISISALAQQPNTYKTKSGLSYVTGGIGEEDVALMKRQAKQFTLNLLLSEGTSGRWVSDANVNIYNEGSQLVFRIVAAKPMLYVNLPAGTYTILANNNGQKLRHKITIEENVNQRIILNWKDSLIEEDMPLDGEGN